MYYLYHIPGKKIGVTRDLNTRVTLIQGYKENEYEVLEQSNDIDYISDREIELQKSYGYKVDRTKYKNLNKKSNQMKINATEQTSTFPCPLNKLKGRLMDNIGLSWKTSHGVFEIKAEHVSWIEANAKRSMYDDKRFYINNKSFNQAFYNLKESLDTFDLIRAWADERGIYKEGNSHTQYVKLMEEAGELAQGLLKKDAYEVKDAIGDMVVVLTNLADLEGMQIESCIESSYIEIAKRKGKMINGTFVKQTL
jgi:NTP pyrophosphatase (non-canonical NTP hydrolase)